MRATAILRRHQHTRWAAPLTASRSAPVATDQKVTATLTVMAASARSAKGPVCYVCRRDGIFDQTARHPAAAVRVGICREPYVLNICERHLAPLQATLPTGGLWLIERYQ
jgi:hypothetical protein